MYPYIGRVGRPLPCRVRSLGRPRDNKKYIWWCCGVEIAREESICSVLPGFSTHAMVSLSFSYVWFCCIIWSTPRSYIANMSTGLGAAVSTFWRIDLTTHEGTSNCFFRRYINLNLKWPRNISAFLEGSSWTDQAVSKISCAHHLKLKEITEHGGPSVWYIQGWSYPRILYPAPK